MRTKFEGAASSQQTQGGDNVQRDQGAARAISSFIDPSLNWADLKELMDAAGDMKVVLKGVQCWEVSQLPNSSTCKSKADNAYRMPCWRPKLELTESC